MDTTRDAQGWAAEFKDRWADADALGMRGHRVEHALEPLLLALAAERDRADRAEARLADAPHEFECKINLRGCMDERCEYRNWTSGQMPTHAYGSGCPSRTLVCNCWKSEATA